MVRIDELSISNFRGLVKSNLVFGDRSTIFFGANGVGKTSILDSIALLLSRFIAQFPNHSSSRKPINESDITYGRVESRLRITVSSENDKCAWGLVRNRQKTFVLNSEDLKQYAAGFVKLLESDPYTAVPICVYYPVNRAVLDIPLRIRTRHQFDQLSTYTKALTSGADFRVFFEWFRNQEDVENEVRAREFQQYEDVQLRAVRKAIYSFMPGFKDLKVVRNPLRMVISKENKRLQVNQLSDGEKCMMALVGDLARRLALGNPGSDDPLQGYGIVLIDEIELHLHPTWQRRVLPLLMSTFPNVQFLLTTHSPQVLGEARDMNIYQLVTDEGGNSDMQVLPDGLFGRDSNRILEEVMNSFDRDETIKRDIESLFDRLMDDDLEMAETLLGSLSRVIGVDDPELIRASSILHRKRTIGR